MNWRILELFSGLGAWRWAAAGRGAVVAAYDISEAANRTYALNHGERPVARELASVRAGELAAHGADTWLLSPPCQPYCRMGNRGDLADPRSRALLHLVDLLPELRPARLALENVVGFLGSQSHARLAAALERLGYQQRAWRLCPTQFGIPNQRPRVFLLAGITPLGPLEPPQIDPSPLGPFLDREVDPGLFLDAATRRRHGPGLDLVTAEAQRSTCFIGGYGRKFVGSGSFLESSAGVRRFAPAEVARLLGLPAPLAFPEDVPLELRYKLLGNALSVPVARWVLQAFPS